MKKYEKIIVFMFKDNHNSQLYVSNSSTHPTNSILGITNLGKYHEHYFHIVIFFLLLLI